MQKVSKGTLSVYASFKWYETPEQMNSWDLKNQLNGESLKKSGPENVLNELKKNNCLNGLVCHLIWATYNEQ